MRVARRCLLALPSTALLALSLAACTSSPEAADAPADSTATSAPPDMTATCNADDIQSFVGMPASESNIADAKADADAKGDVRLIAPGQPVTMDFRGDRLNIEVDEGNIITRISCG